MQVLFEALRPTSTKNRNLNLTVDFRQYQVIIIKFPDVSIVRNREDVPKSCDSEIAKLGFREKPPCE
jgi:hypothetical protein